MTNTILTSNSNKIVIRVGSSSSGNPIVTSNNNKIVIKMKDMGLFSCNLPSVVKNSPINVVGSITVEQISNVLSSNNESTGDTLVYDNTLKKWVIKTLDLSEVSGSLDDGEF